jgi:hypothetical protein
MGSYVTLSESLLYLNVYIIIIIIITTTTTTPTTLSTEKKKKDNINMDGCG